MFVSIVCSKLSDRYMHYELHVRYSCTPVLTRFDCHGLHCLKTSIFTRLSNFFLTKIRLCSYFNLLLFKFWPCRQKLHSLHRSSKTLCTPSLILKMKKDAKLQIKPFDRCTVPKPQSQLPPARRSNTCVLQFQDHQLACAVCFSVLHNQQTSGLKI